MLVGQKELARCQALLGDFNTHKVEAGSEGGGDVRTPSPSRSTTSDSDATDSELWYAKKGTPERSD